MKLTYICKICGLESVNNNGLISHITQTHKLSSKEYYDKFFKKENEGICPVCGKETQFIKFSLGYRKTCSYSCASTNNAEDRKQVRYNNYDGKYFSKEGRENLNKIASETFESRNKQNIEKLKTEYKIPNEVEITNISQIKEIKDKKEQTNIEKYGIKNSFLIKDENGEEKRIKTSNEKYGTDYPMQNDKLQDNRIKTCIDKYDSLYFTHKYKYNDLKFDSSWELAYYIWLKDNNIQFTYQPRPAILYFWNGDNKYHKYYPDFIVNDEIIEIKNPYLYSKFLLEGTKDNAKYKKMLEYNVKILTDCYDYLNYIELQYGKNYLDEFKL